MKTIAFSRGVPATKSLPKEKLAVCSQAVLEKSGDVLLQYGKGAGYLPLRERLANDYCVDVEQVIIGQGSLQIFDHLSRIMLKKRDYVIVEQPTYDRALTLLIRTPAQITGIEMQEEGLDCNVLQEWLETKKAPKFIYVIPDFQNPTGALLSLDKRKALLRMAHDYGFLIIEDAPYRSLRYCGKALPSLFDLAPEQVVHLSSFSKTISPGLRVGYAIAPKKIAKDLANFAEDTYINVSYLNQAIVEDFIARGWLNENIQALKELYSDRMNVLLKCLDDHLSDFGRWVKPQGGFFVGVHLNKHVDMANFLDANRSQDVLLSDGRGFCVDGGTDFLRLPFCALQPMEIEEGINRLGKILKTICT